MRKLAWVILIIIFLSKISFAFIDFPRQLGFIIFQNGMHPYLNVFINWFLGGLLLYLHSKRSDLGVTHHVGFKFLAYGTMILLTVQTLFQLMWGIENNLFLISVTLASTWLLVILFGFVIPESIPLDEFLVGVSRICHFIILISLILYVFGSPLVFKGNRFIGIFKHIPYMVSCATMGFIFNLVNWHKIRGKWDALYFAVTMMGSAYALYLTGTRSAIIACLVAAALFFVFNKATSFKSQFVKVFSVWLFVLGGVFFGGYAYHFAVGVIRGDFSIGQREAQDGIEDRMEEVSRGLEQLESSPWFGLGLLSKFGGTDAESVVESYNSFQDPHNLLVSSAVLAGWPFAIIVGIGFLMLAFRSLWKLFAFQDNSQLVLAIFLISHLPILFIYHMHLSLGGLADRLYWICFGYLGIKILSNNNFTKINRLT